MVQSHGEAGALSCARSAHAVAGNGGAVKLAPLRRRRRGERAPVKLGALGPRSGREHNKCHGGHVLMRYIVQVLLLIVTHLAYGADYIREKKWADEITPGIVVGDPVYLEGRAGHKFLTIYTEAPKAQAGLVIVHGIGVHPDHGLIGTLRSALADHGYTTLSVQMPVLAAEASAEEYPSTFGEAGERLQVAVEFLQAKGYKKIAIVSHSMGSSMTHAYLTRDASAPVNAWVCIGLGGEDDFR